MRDEPCTSRRDKRRVAMLEAAHRLFLERGYGATTLAEVVKCSGGSLATLYDLFEGKEGLFRAVIAGQCVQIAESLEQAEMADLPPAQALRRFAEAIFDIVLSKDSIALLRQIIAEASQFPELGRTLFATGVEVIHSKVDGYLRRQTARGLLDISEPRVASNIFIEMVLQQYRMRLLCGVPVSLTAEEKKAHLDRTLAVFLRAFGPAQRNP
ncbi:TetR/AcrR family transcriptional regulator [Magnetospirillum sulfuroxidans]|uniref:TetR/AcrR family transcriptional regulator n=1 Tax=Magnetospirillum sulfuroxidans TaxID=611300 RepID=A0ABS5IER9_9PROT|nr:TetR/AcrR family transcriptional regulator [Magnetospirillum sulfuroxidans]MBR9972228.1 TetR/AcrR family transcriptional regulator [Magnetospirillum sulfuroxidans]